MQMLLEAGHGMAASWFGRAGQIPVVQGGHGGGQGLAAAHGVHAPAQVVSVSTPRMPLTAWPPALPDIARIRRPVAPRAVVRRRAMARRYPDASRFDLGGLEEVQGVAVLLTIG